MSCPSGLSRSTVHLVLRTESVGHSIASSRETAVLSNQRQVRGTGRHPNADRVSESASGVAEFYEDVTVGEQKRFGQYEMTREEMTQFARQYDPQWFHTDPERAAAESPYGELIASGWHTAAATMRLLVENVLREAATVGAKGLDSLRWPAPVTAGDVLEVEYEVLEKTPDSPDRGTLRVQCDTYADDEHVCSMVSRVMYRRRSADG